MLDRTLAPKIQEVSRVEFQKVNELTLPNGALFCTLEAGEQPVIKLEILFPNAGNTTERLKGQASMAVKMLKEGTLSYSSEHITHLFSNLGAYIEVSPSFDNASMSIYCLDKHLRQIIPVLSEIIDKPAFHEKELNLQKELQVAQLQIQNKKNNILASKAVRQSLFGKTDAYGRIIYEDDIKTLEPEDLRQFWEVAKNKFQILVSGRPSKDSLTLLQEFFATKQYDPSKSARNEISSEYQVYSNESVQASIRIGKRSLLKSHEDYISLLIANHLLGGFFGSRLMKNIREDKGLTYGINSSIVPLQEASYWVVGAEVNTDNVDLAMKEIYAEMNQMAHFDDVEELVTAKTHMIGSFQSELNSPFALMNRYKSVHLHGLDYSYYAKFFDTIERFTTADVRTTAQKYLMPQDLKEIIIN